jgi:NADH-quinone oxidoreductase subunit L
MWRLMNLTFYGKSRVAPETAKHIHESPASMTVPLVLLATGSVFVGWLGTPKVWTIFGDSFRGFERWLAPSFATAAAEAAKEGEHSASTEWILMGLSVAVAIIGISIARYFYNNKPEIPDSIEKAVKPLHSLLYNKRYVDEVYDFLFVDGLCKGGGLALGAFDRNVVDGGVNGAGWLTRFTGKLSMWWDTWIVDGAVRFTSFCVKMLSYPVCILETGRLQTYAFFVVVGVLVMFGYYVVR